MTVAKLISLLQKCNPNAQVSAFIGNDSDSGNFVVEFVEHQLTANSVLLLTEEPDWKQAEKDDGVNITLLKRETFFAETTWKDI